MGGVETRQESTKWITIEARLDLGRLPSGALVRHKGAQANHNGRDARTAVLTAQREDSDTEGVPKLQCQSH